MKTSAGTCSLKALPSQHSLLPCTSGETTWSSSDGGLSAQPCSSMYTPSRCSSSHSSQEGNPHSPALAMCVQIKAACTPNSKAPPDLPQPLATSPHPTPATAHLFCSTCPSITPACAACAATNVCTPYGRAEPEPTPPVPTSPSQPDISNLTPCHGLLPPACGLSKLFACFGHGGRGSAPSSVDIGSGGSSSLASCSTWGSNGRAPLLRLVLGSHNEGEEAGDAGEEAAAAALPTCTHTATPQPAHAAGSRQGAVIASRRVSWQEAQRAAAEVGAVLLLSRGSAQAPRAAVGAPQPATQPPPSRTITSTTFDTATSGSVAAARDEEGEALACISLPPTPDSDAAPAPQDTQRQHHHHQHDAAQQCASLTSAASCAGSVQHDGSQLVLEGSVGSSACAGVHRPWPAWWRCSTGLEHVLGPTACEAEAEQGVEGSEEGSDGSCASEVCPLPSPTTLHELATLLHSLTSHLDCDGSGAQGGPTQAPVIDLGGACLEGPLPAVATQPPTATTNTPAHHQHPHQQQLRITTPGLILRNGTLKLPPGVGVVVGARGVRLQGLTIRGWPAGLVGARATPLATAAALVWVRGRGSAQLQACTLHLQQPALPTPSMLDVEECVEEAVGHADDDDSGRGDDMSPAPPMDCPPLNASEFVRSGWAGVASAAVCGVLVTGAGSSAELMTCTATVTEAAPPPTASDAPSAAPPAATPPEPCSFSASTYSSPSVLLAWEDGSSGTRGTSAPPAPSSHAVMVYGPGASASAEWCTACGTRGAGYVGGSM